MGVDGAARFALALCGYLCAGAYPEAEFWLVAGCARLASQIHWRKAALNDQVAADCLGVVCRVAEELDLPILADLITLRERMWGELLDHTRAERWIPRLSHTVDVFSGADGTHDGGGIARRF